MAYPLEWDFASPRSLKSTASFSSKQSRSTMRERLIAGVSRQSRSLSPRELLTTTAVSPVHQSATPRASPASSVIPLSNAAPSPWISANKCLTGLPATRYIVNIINLYLGKALRSGDRLALAGRLCEEQDFTYSSNSTAGGTHLALFSWTKVCSVRAYSMQVSFHP